jgi:hypothetical protein
MLASAVRNAKAVFFFKKGKSKNTTSTTSTTNTHKEKHITQQRADKPKTSTSPASSSLTHTHTPLLRRKRKVIMRFYDACFASPPPPPPYALHTAKQALKQTKQTKQKTQTHVDFTLPYYGPCLFSAKISFRCKCPNIFVMMAPYGVDLFLFGLLPFFKITPLFTFTPQVSYMLFNESRISELVEAILNNAASLTPRPSNNRGGTSSQPPPPPPQQSTQLARVLGAAIRSRTITRATLPLIVQRICRQPAMASSAAGWVVALALIQHPTLRPTHRSVHHSRQQQEPAASKRNDSTTSTVAFGFGGKAVTTELCDDAKLWRLLEADAPSKEAKDAVSNAMRVLVRER